MKNLVKVTFAIALLTILSLDSKAQIRPSVGLEVGTSLDNGFGVGFGVTGGIESLMGDNAGITGRLGYIILTMDNSLGDNGSASMIPIQAGYKYYFDSNEGGVYLHGQLGFTMFKYSFDFETIDFDPVTFQTTTRTETFDYSKTGLSYAVGAGFLVNENIDLGLRYNIVTLNGGNLDYLGLRAAYNF